MLHSRCALTATISIAAAIAEALLERETLDRSEIDAIMSGEDLPPPRIVSVPTYAEKRREDEEKRKGAIFQPRPREVPTPS